MDMKADFPLSEHLTARATQVTAATHDEADKEMAAMLAGAYEDVKAMLTRNRGALDLAIDALLEQTTLSGAEVRHRKQQAASCSCALAALGGICVWQIAHRWGKIGCFEPARPAQS